MIDCNETELWDAKRVAAYLAVSVDAVYRMHHDGTLPAARMIGKRKGLRWDRMAVEQHGRAADPPDDDIAQ